MATVNKIKFYLGEAVRLLFTMDPVQDVSGWTVTLTIEAPTTITKTPATLLAPTAGGQFQFQLSHDDTKDIPVGSYRYDVQRVDAGAEAVLSIGTITVQDESLY